MSDISETAPGIVLNPVRIDGVRKHASTKLTNIQLLRALAASGVIIDHSIISQYGSDGSNPLTQIGWHLGNIGVWIFFVISGFIMFYSESANFGSIRNAIYFARKRLTRIVPMYWIVTAVAVVFSLLSKHAIPPHATPTLQHILSSLFFIPYAVSTSERPLPILGPGWTLEYEMLFYSLFFLAMMLTKAKGIPFLICTLLLIAVVGIYIKPFDANIDSHTVAEFVADPIILLFGVGILIAILSSYGSKLPSYYMLSILTLMVLSVAIFFYGNYQYPLNSYQRFVFFIPCILMVLVSFYTLPISGGFGKLCVLLGDASYATYLINLMVLESLAKLLKSLSIHMNFGIYLVLSMMLAHACGVLMHIAVERPLLGVFRRSRV